MQVSARGGLVALHLAIGNHDAIEEVFWSGVLNCMDLWHQVRRTNLDVDALGQGADAQQWRKDRFAEVCEVLCEAKADPNVMAKDGRTPLHSAAYACCWFLWFSA